MLRLAITALVLPANDQNAVAEINDQERTRRDSICSSSRRRARPSGPSISAPKDGQTANVGYYRCVNGATDLTTDITQYAGQTGDEFFASSEAYARGVWTPLNVPEGPGDPRHVLNYAP